MEKLIQRINELAKKKREEGLSEEEQKEQKELYKEYLSAFRGNMKKQLENIDVEYDDGTVVKLTDLNRKN